MALFRIRIRLRAPLGTPLSSGTLFGHLCWARLESEGEEALVRWLARLPESPWAVSDAFPADHLPRPLLAPVLAPPPVRIDRAETERRDARKEALKRPWITAADWRALRAGLHGEALIGRLRSMPSSDQRLVHNTIDRRTGTTLETGGLYVLDEDWSFTPLPERDIYVRAETDAAELHRLFGAVGAAGYGRDATYGRGVFEVGAVEPAGWLDEQEGKRRMSLSHGVLSPNMHAPRYRLFTLFGKVGPRMTASGARPWKHPILLTRPGATFAAGDEGPFGGWLTGVHQDRPEIGHNAFHLAIPYTEVEAPR